MAYDDGVVGSCIGRVVGGVFSSVIGRVVGGVFRNYIGRVLMEWLGVVFGV